MSLPTSLRVTFNRPELRPNEQPNIITLCTTAWENVQALRPSRDAVVYPVGQVWWHTNDNDRREHITVWYDSRAANSRVHIYRDGTVNLRPDRPRVSARALALSAESSAAEAAGDEEGYDTVPELSDEEWPEDDAL